MLLINWVNPSGKKQIDRISDIFLSKQQQARCTPVFAYLFLKLGKRKVQKEGHWIFQITMQLSETSIHYSKRSTYNTSAMEKLLQVAHQLASKVEVTENDIDEVLFLQFMKKIQFGASIRSQRLSICRRVGRGESLYFWNFTLKSKMVRILFFLFVFQCW